MRNADAGGAGSWDKAMSLQGYFLLLGFLFVAPPFVGFGLNVAQTYMVFDLILEAQYRRHFSAWNADGRTTGSRWHPAGAGERSSEMARLRLMRRWATHTPEWASDDPAATELFCQFQRLRTHARRWMIAAMAGVSIAGVAYTIIVACRGT
jgi:hypothetical protein